MNYLPFYQREPDSQYASLLENILAKGEVVKTRQGPQAFTVMQQSMTYNLRNGFPVITERSLKVFWQKPIGELCAFINGATTHDQFLAFGCNWWKPWTEKKKPGVPEGSLGPGSYGGAFTDFFGYDQFNGLVENIKKYPNDRTHFITPWIPQHNLRDNPRTTISPCHGWVHIRVINEQLHLHMFQRSGDVPVGVPSNMIQYAALLLMLEQLTGYAASTFYHTISDAHIYENQIPMVKQMLIQEARKLPTVSITTEGKKITNIKDFRAEHFELEDYFPNKYLSIPVSV